VPSESPLIAVVTKFFRLWTICRYRRKYQIESALQGLGGIFIGQFKVGPEHREKVGHVAVSEWARQRDKLIPAPRPRFPNKDFARNLL
jgi:hypothetical protein